MTETKIFPAEIKSIDAEKGIVRRLAAVFGNVDLQNDRIITGAFTKAITDQRAKMDAGGFLPVVYGHRDDPDFIVGKVIALDQTPDGLETTEQYFLDKPKARSTFDAIREGVLPGGSFGYDVGRARMAKDGVRELLELSLLEVGPTIYPANTATRVLSVKGVDVVAEGSVTPLADDEVVQAFGEALTKAFERAAETKVGRTISAKHEAALAQARDLIGGVLDSVAGTAAEELTDTAPSTGKADEPQVKAEPAPTDPDRFPALAAARALFDG